MLLADASGKDILAVVLRVLHIGAAIVAAGAVFFQWFALRPAMRHLPDAQRDELARRVVKRWRAVVFTVMVVLLVTGLATFLAYRVPEYHAHPHKLWYHLMFGLKFLAALAVFHAATVLVLPGTRFDAGYRARAGFWQGYMLVLYALIVTLGAVMRYFHALFDPPAAAG